METLWAPNVLLFVATKLSPDMDWTLYEFSLRCHRFL